MNGQSYFLSNPPYRSSFSGSRHSLLDCCRPFDVAPEVVDCVADALEARHQINPFDRMDPFTVQHGPTEAN